MTDILSAVVRFALDDGFRAHQESVKQRRARGIPENHIHVELEPDVARVDITISRSALQKLRDHNGVVETSDVRKADQGAALQAKRAIVGLADVRSASADESHDVLVELDADDIDLLDDGQPTGIRATANDAVEPYPLYEAFVYMSSEAIDQ
ncbi:hypothetical protein ACIA5D_51400 [Actinoplanes sp. NPDC051513]|uniref:hypothetical protein n=1 Tax=Actinoplanes sp. NPDC051513 TaxID=3363908 RepID=UPI0037A5CF39